MLFYLSVYLVVYAVFLIVYRLVSGEWSWLATLGLLVGTEIFRLTTHIFTRLISPDHEAAVPPAADAPASPHETDRPT